MYFLTDDTGAKVDDGDPDNDEVQPAPGVAEVGHNAHGHQLEAGLEEEDDGEDLVEVVEDVHEHGLGGEPDILERHHEAAEEDQSQDHRLEVFVLNQSALTFSLG